jgi:hypothetical protein
VIDLADLARRYGLRLSTDGKSIPFHGGRIVEWAATGELAFVTTGKQTSRDLAVRIRSKATQTIHWNCVTGDMTVVFPLDRLPVVVAVAKSNDLEFPRPKFRTTRH